MLWLWRSKERGLINEKEYQTIKFITKLQHLFFQMFIHKKIIMII
ncbi:MAG: hypothetical protein IGBAC_0127 [Ignavibacteriae bacterium]|nr:MAG: hypothetical protein IGBAC_0127 [Ignavibacteriota bacterium]